MYTLARLNGTPYTLLPLFSTVQAAHDYARWELTWLIGTYTITVAPVGSYAA